TGGDPGLFGSLWGGIKKIGGAAVGAVGGLATGGPLGAIGGALGGLGIGGGVERYAGPMAVSRFAQQGPPPLPSRRTTISMPGLGPIFETSRGIPGVNLGLQYGPQENGENGACPPGYRRNKTSYFLRDGSFVEKGSRCVKVRRRNALNPRALDRAIGRVTGAKRAASKLGCITVRKPKCKTCH
ncbi:MAG: hypothetical protein ABFS46_18155, partial [Myxococcota bacterium]